MKNISVREKVFLVVLFVVIFGYIYYTFFLNPMLGKINDANKNITDYNSKLDQIQSIVESNDKYEEKYNAMIEKFTLYSKRIPNAVREPEIAYNFKGLADSNSSKIMGVSFGINTESVDQSEDQTEDQTAKLLPVSVTCSLLSKDYQSAINMIKAIETDSRLAEVTSLSLAPNKGEASESQSILVSLGLNYYYVPDPNNTQNEYTFNSGTNGKKDIFK